MGASITTWLLNLIGVKQDPKYEGPLEIAEGVVRSLAHLIAVDGQFSRLLTCDSSGRLQVAPDTEVHAALDALHADLATTLHGDAQSMVSWLVLIRSVLVDILTVLSDANIYLSELDSILHDVWDESLHTIRTSPGP
jgi:hypothetical protein